MDAVNVMSVNERNEEAETEDGAKTDIVQRVVDGVTYCIRADQMVPGQHLVEADLTLRFEVSRGSLREGLKHLASQGVVELTRYRGAFIAVLDRQSVRDLLDVLETLCSLAARHAAQHSQNEHDREALKSIALDLARIVEHGGQALYLERRRDFYDALVRMSGNSELGRVIPLARTDLFRAQFETAQNKSQKRRHAAGYLRIAEAVAAGEVNKAVKAVAKHFAGTRKTLESLPDRVFASGNAFGRRFD